MSNNFLGVGSNTGLSKNAAEGIMNLLQLSLLGNNAGVNLNSPISPGQNLTGLNASGLSSNSNLLTNKSNYYPHQVSGSNLNALGNIANAVNLTQQQVHMQPIVKTGRPIVNTANLASNSIQQQVRLLLISYSLDIGCLCLVKLWRDTKHTTTKPTAVATMQYLFNLRFCAFFDCNFFRSHFCGTHSKNVLNVLKRLPTFGRSTDWPTHRSIILFICHNICVAHRTMAPYRQKTRMATLQAFTMIPCWRTLRTRCA